MADNPYFNRREPPWHCACGTLVDACRSFEGPDWTNPWTGRRLSPNTQTWRRVTRHCRFPEGREDEAADLPGPDDDDEDDRRHKWQHRTGRKVRFVQVIRGPAAESAPSPIVSERRIAGAYNKVNKTVTVTARAAEIQPEEPVIEVPSVALQPERRRRPFSLRRKKRT